MTQAVLSGTPALAFNSVVRSAESVWSRGSQCSVLISPPFEPAPTMEQQTQNGHNLTPTVFSNPCAQHPVPPMMYAMMHPYGGDPRQLAPGMSPSHPMLPPHGTPTRPAGLQFVPAFPLNTTNVCTRNWDNRHSEQICAPFSAQQSSDAIYKRQGEIDGRSNRSSGVVTVPSTSSSAEQQQCSRFDPLHSMSSDGTLPNSDLKVFGQKRRRRNFTRRLATEIERLYYCDICTKGYGSMSALSLHIRRKHIAETVQRLGLGSVEHFRTRHARELAIQMNKVSVPIENSIRSTQHPKYSSMRTNNNSVHSFSNTPAGISLDPRTAQGSSEDGQAGPLHTHVTEEPGDLDEDPGSGSNSASIHASFHSNCAVATSTACSTLSTVCSDTCIEVTKSNSIIDLDDVATSLMQLAAKRYKSIGS